MYLSRWFLSLCLAGGLAAAERWEMRYFFDQDRSTLRLVDLTFPTPQRGVAVGSLIDEGRIQGRALVTSDGGAHWSLVPLAGDPISVFFVNDTLGWAVTSKGLYRSEEGGRSWKKLRAPKDIVRVHFLDPRRGFAVGFKKQVLATRDGGETWSKVAAAGEPQTKVENTVYASISFATDKVGIITGWSRPPRMDETGDLPAWMEPEEAERRREVPGVAITLETRDGGESWRADTVSVFGRITRLRLAPDGRGLSLLEFTSAFPYASEVLVLNWHKPANTRAYREKERAVTDVVLTPSGTGYLAAVEVPGKMVRPPVPGKLRMLKSDDLKTWRQMDVDYRASARRAVMAAADARNVWVATDTGMVLKLVE